MGYDLLIEVGWWVFEGVLLYFRFCFCVCLIFLVIKLFLKEKKVLRFYLLEIRNNY